MTREMKWLTILIVSLCGGAIFVACGDDGGSTTTAASPSSTTLGDLDTTSAMRHSDDDSSDDDSSDDDSSDDDGSDDDGVEAADAAGSDTDVRGLFFGFVECSDCVLAVQIKDTVVVVTEDTRVDNEPMLAEGLPPGDLLGLLTGHLGLPMRAEGSNDSGVLVASRIRIDDEIRASGVVVPDAPGCDVSLLVRDANLCFAFAVAGLSDPTVGVEARIEGVVPADFNQPFQATEIEILD